MEPRVAAVTLSGFIPRSQSSSQNLPIPRLQRRHRFKSDPPDGTFPRCVGFISHVHLGIKKAFKKEGDRWTKLLSVTSNQISSPQVEPTSNSVTLPVC